MHFANCVALAAVLFTSLIENLRLCSSAEAGIVLNLLLNFKQNWASCSYKIVLIKKRNLYSLIGTGFSFGVERIFRSWFLFVYYSNIGDILYIRDI